MTTADDVIRENVSKFVAAMGALDAAAFAALFTPEALYWDPVGHPPMRARETAAGWFRALSSIFKTMRMIEEETFVSGGEAALKWRCEADLSRNGTLLTFSGVSIIAFADGGLIHAVRSYWDKARVMEQVKAAGYEGPSRQH